MTGRVSWRGVTLDTRSAAMMDEVAALVFPAPVTPTQGSYSGGVGASAGTHDGGGAIDIAAASLTPDQRAQIVAAMRQVGWAAWLRTPAQSDWPFHIHGIAVGCPDLAPAAANQVADYLAEPGRNGLASGAPDDGPRDWVGTTWETYEGDDMTPEQAATLDNTAWLVGQIKGQTDLISPRLMQPVDETAWLVAEAVLTALEDLSRQVSAVATAIGTTADPITVQRAAP